MASKAEIVLKLKQEIEEVSITIDGIILTKWNVHLGNQEMSDFGYKVMDQVHIWMQSEKWKLNKAKEKLTDINLI